MAKRMKEEKAKKNIGFSAFNLQSGDMVIDLGSKNTCIYVKDKGVVMHEQSCVAIDTLSGAVVAAGSEAYEMAGKTSENISVEFPIKNGGVADVEVASAMLKFFIKKYVGTGFVAKPRVILTVPSAINEVERIAVEAAAKNAGADIVELIEYPLAAALGTEKAVSSCKGAMFISMGAGITECAVICAGDVVTSTSVRRGGENIDKEIVRLLRRKYGINIGLQTAEKIKKEIGSVYPEEALLGAFVEARGRSVAEGIPKAISLHADEVRPLCAQCVQDVVNIIKDTVEKTSAELVSDIMDTGVIVAGGASLIKGLDKYIESETGLNVYYAKDTFFCAVEGAGKAMDIVFDKRDLRKNGK